MQGINNNFTLAIGSKAKILEYLLIIFAITGILLSVELTIVYHNANFTAAHSLCNVNETINCDAVAKTQYSHFLGVPLSVYGFVFYALILFLSIVPYFKNNFLNKTLKNPQSCIFSLATMSIFTSIMLGWISSAQIHKICILCYTTYLLNILIFFVSKSNLSFAIHYKNAIADIKAFLSCKAAAVWALLFAAVIGGGLYYFNASQIFVPKDTNKISLNNENSPFSGNAAGNILGSEKPKLIINEYTDYECPYCAISNAVIHRLVKEIDGVQVIHHDYPLSRACNPAMKQSPHKYTCKAALYARAAKKQGQFWSMAGLLFDNQENLSESEILRLAKSLKLDINRLKKDAYDPKAKTELLEDVKKANTLGITATPTYFINSKKYEGLMPYPEFKQVILENMGRK